jgi:hypothetical protein
MVFLTGPIGDHSRLSDAGCIERDQTRASDRSAFTSGFLFTTITHLAASIPSIALRGGHVRQL